MTAYLHKSELKVGIVTLHRVLNFGSVLQAYCTCVVLKRLGYQAEIIDYMESRFTVQGAIKDIFRRVFHERQRGGGVYKLILALLKMVSYAIQYRNFERFISTYLRVGERRFTTFDAIQREPPYADIYLTGSDQVWNSEYNGGVDRSHFLDFAPAGKPRISYAASFGKDKLRPDEVCETKTLLGKYSSISVRESSGVQIIEDLGMRGAQQVLDPTLLMSRDEWAKEFHLVKPEEERYLLIYSVERCHDEIVYAIARQIADIRGLKVVFISQAAKLSSMKGCDSQRPFSTVNDFLRYFYHADFVVANSFHGTAFAINFNRQFVSVLPPKFGGRSRSLLNLVGLDDRVVENRAGLEKTNDPIDYSSVNLILGRERMKSLVFLKTSLDTYSTAP